MSEKRFIPCECCGKLVLWNGSVWLRGRLMCPKCFEEAINKERNNDYQAEQS